MNRNDKSPAKRDGVSDIKSSTSPVKPTDKPKRRIATGKVRHDENCFTIGVFNLMISTFLISAFPWNYWIWHTAKMLVLLMYRRFKFAKIKYQYFLLDFCYTANYWSILYYGVCLLKNNVELFSPLNSILNPWEGILFRVLFTWCVGPLAVSIAFFRNSLVFHSSDQIIILATHLSPNLAVYGMRWWARELNVQFPNLFHIDCDTSASSLVSTVRSFNFFDAGNNCDASVSSLVVVSMCSYIILWTIPYALFFFYLGKKKLEEGGYHTMYTSMRESTPLMRKVLSLVGEAWQPLIYMMIHGVLCSSTFIIAPFVWNSLILHTSYLLLLVLASVNNAGTYYFEVFADRYYKSVDEKKD
jgi:Protein of unknown function (DUF2838)